MPMASSIPPSTARCFWNTCMTTCGRRPSASSAERPKLKYASGEEPAFIFSTGRSKISGGRRWRRRVPTSVAMLELEAGGQCGLRHLELLRRRLRGGEAVLELVARPSERLRQRALRVPHHPAEDLGGGCHGSDRRGQSGWAPKVRRCPRRQRGAHGGGNQQRPDQMGAAAFVLARPRLAVLVGSDRDVLRAVVGGEVAAAQRKCGRGEREQAAHQLLGHRGNSFGAAKKSDA